MLEWWDVRWDEQFPEVSGIEQVLLRLDELVTEDEGFAYKQFIFDEDDEDTKVRVNGIGEFPLYDYFVLKSVCNPETITEEGAAKRIAISVEAELVFGKISKRKFMGRTFGTKTGGCCFYDSLSCGGY